MGATSELMRGPRRVRCPPTTRMWGNSVPLLHTGGTVPPSSTRGHGTPPLHAGCTAHPPTCGGHGKMPLAVAWEKPAAPSACT